MTHKTGDMVHVSGGIITHGGLVCEVMSVTPKQIVVTVKYLFFPVHKRLGRPDFQVDADEQAWQRQGQVGRVLRFWTAGSCKGAEVGSSQDWWHPRRLMRPGTDLEQTIRL